MSRCGCISFSRVVSYGFIIVLILALSGIRIAASAEKSLQPGIIGEDDRQPASTDNLAWSAIGQVNIGGLRRQSLCTGSLISPRLVLTAAHCVFNKWKERPYLLDRVHFVAGVRPGNTWLAHGMAECLKFPPGFVTGDAKTDIALIVLKEPMSEAPVLEIDRKHALAAGTRLTAASYPADRRFQLMVHRDCQVLSRFKGLVATDCDGHFAASGGPILVDAPSGMKVVGVLSYVVEKTATVFVALDAWPGMPLTETCP